MITAADAPCTYFKIFFPLDFLRLYMNACASSNPCKSSLVQIYLLFEIRYE